MKVIITINTENAAFERSGGHEVARILRAVATDANALPTRYLDRLSRRLLDVNGNTVGAVEVVDG